MPGSGENGTAGDSSEPILADAAGEGDPCGACDGVDGQAVNSGRVATDGEAHESVAVDRIVAGRGSGVTVGVVPDDDPVAADLSVPILLREVQAEVPCAVGIGGGVLPGGRGADHVVAGHESFALVPIV